MGCLLSMFRFGSYVVKDPDNTIAGSGTQINTPEIRKHSSTPVVETTPKQKKAKPIQSSPAKPDRHIVPQKVKQKEKALYTTTFETQVDAAPPHPLEERLQDVQFDEIEIDTNLYTPEVEDAVVKIQAGVRGYLARKQVTQIRNSREDVSLEQDTPVVPPPKSFDDLNTNRSDDDIQTLAPLLNDLQKWKSLSQHLEEKVIDGNDKPNDSIEANITSAEEQSKQPTITTSNKLIDEIIPLKDSNDHKNIETYVCKENILDDIPSDDKPKQAFVAQNSPPLLKTSSERAVERVFNVLMSETESENIMSFIESQTTATKSMSSVVTTTKSTDYMNNKTIESLETPEQRVLSQLNEILDNDDKIENIVVIENNVKPVAVEEEQNAIKAFESDLVTNESKVSDISSQNTRQELMSTSVQESIIRHESSDVQKNITDEFKIEEQLMVSKDDLKNRQELIDKSIVESIKELNQKQTINKFEPKVEEQLADTRPQEIMEISPIIVEPSEDLVQNQVTTEPKVEEQLIDSNIKSENIGSVECRPEERKTDSMIFEEEVVQNIFDKEFECKNPIMNEVIAIELFKHDISEEQLENLTTINEPEETKWNVEDRVYKTSVDEFVVKPIEQPIPVEQSAPVFVDNTSDVLPVLEHKIEIISTGSRKNSVDLMDDNEGHFEEELGQTMEVLQIPSPVIQVEEQNGRVLDEEEAAIRIQAAFRGYQIRRSMSRETSPAPNHNNIDNNNNTNNNNNENNEELISYETNNDLSNACNTSEQYLTTTDVQNNSNANLMTASNEQINSSLERLENQLMQELISSAEEEDKNVALINNSEMTSQALLEDMDLSANELTAPLLLQRLQQSAEHQKMAEEVVVQEVDNSPVIVHTFPKETEALPVPNSESLPQKPTEDQSIESIEDKPLIQKSDTIIVDLLSSSPQKISPINDNMDANTSKPEDIETNSNIESKNTEILELSQESQQISADSTERIPESKPELPELIPEPETGPIVQTSVEPPTPSEERLLTEILPEMSYIETPQQPVLTKLYSSESEQESETLTASTVIDNRPSLIPVLEANTKNKSGDKPDAPKRPKPILKEKDTQFHTHLIPDEQMQSNSEEISSPDDDNPETTGLGPNNPIPVRASSPNPFGKKRRRGKKSGNRKN